VHGDSMQGQKVTGIGQGNGASPTIWVVVRLPLFKMMKSGGFFTTVCCAMLGLQKDIGSFVFVDDTDLCMSGFDSPTKMAVQMQKQLPIGKDYYM